MAKYIVNTLLSTIVTMLIVTVSLFYLIDISTNDIALKILGQFSTPEQRASFTAQLGLDAPTWQRYVDWLFGNDWRVQTIIKKKLVTFFNPISEEIEWWVLDNEELVRWKFDDNILYRMIWQPDGKTKSKISEEHWEKDDQGREYFWGVTNTNSAIMWVKGKNKSIWTLTDGGLVEEKGAAEKYCPLQKGLLRGDPGKSLQFNRPVSRLLPPRIVNSALLASVAFIFVMPIALIMGILAGINPSKPIDRIITVTSLIATATPVFGIWLQILPAVTLFTSSSAAFKDPKMLILPVLTLAAVELGYVARLTRTSMVEVMSSSYIRAAIAKGLPYWYVVVHHAIRNSLMTPVTIIMLHINWLIGGLVVVEVLFGYPGLGKYIYDAAIFGDYNAVLAAAMLTVVIAVATRIIGDLFYTFLNPKIRYS
jgi:peptide/nickel transport system permease protein